MLTPLFALALVGPPLETQPFPLKAHHGMERTVQKVSLRVPADYRRPGTRTLEIGAYLFPARRASPAPPIVFLMGGPGIAATLLAPIPPYFDLFDRLSEDADVVVLDQRGLGQSIPRVDCPPPRSPLPRDLFLSKARLLGAFEAVNAACVAHWRRASVEPGDFSIEQVADDVESLRAALGVEQVDLLAFSWGTRIASEVLRRHPRSVRKAVLQGVLASTVRMPDTDDRTFRAVAALARPQAKAKGFDGDLERALRSLQGRLSRAPLEVAVTSSSGQEVLFPVGRDVFDALVATRLGDRRLPAMLATATRGDTTILGQWIEALVRDLEKGSAPLMRAALICSAAEDRRTADEARRQGSRSLLGEPFDNLQQSEPYCRALGLPGRPARPAPFRSTTPVLLISGTLDDRTPSERAEAVRKSFPVSQHIIVRNGGHELLPEPKIQDLVVAFLRDRALTETDIELATPDFPDLEAAKRPPRRGP
jgi:pimeloyl-ACP methyl ester carboxylesterase